MLSNVTGPYNFNLECILYYIQLRHSMSFLKYEVIFSLYNITVMWPDSPSDGKLTTLRRIVHLWTILLIAKVCLVISTCYLQFYSCGRCVCIRFFFPLMLKVVIILLSNFFAIPKKNTFFPILFLQISPVPSMVYGAWEVIKIFINKIITRWLLITSLWCHLSTVI